VAPHCLISEFLKVFVRVLLWVFARFFRFYLIWLGQYRHRPKLVLKVVQEIVFYFVKFVRLFPFENCYLTVSVKYSMTNLRLQGIRIVFARALERNSSFIF